ncbi:hypothetical protein K8I61_09230, partial [bacterium]|nr:hypothetical protein [bacterium]
MLPLLLALPGCSCGDDDDSDPANGGTPDDDDDSVDDDDSGIDDDAGDDDSAVDDDADDDSASDDDSDDDLDDDIYSCEPLPDPPVWTDICPKSWPVDDPIGGELCIIGGGRGLEENDVQVGSDGNIYALVSLGG